MNAVIEVNAGGMLWRIAPEHREILLDESGLRLDEWLRDGQARVVKHAPHRTVYQVSLPGLRFFLKHNRRGGWLRPGKALAEYDRAVEVAAREVPTYSPLGAGVPERGHGGGSFLLTRALESTIQLDRFLEKELPNLPARRQSYLRQRIAIALGELLARMHDAGLVHRDLHPGNLLLQLHEDLPQLYIIDLDAARLRSPLDWRASRDNLIILNRWFSVRASRADRLRCWHAYCAWRRSKAGQQKVTGCVCPHRLREVETRTLASNVAFWHHLDKRCLENNRRFRRVSFGAVRGHAVTDLDTATLETLMRDPDAPFRQSGNRMLKDSRSSTVVELDVRLGGVVHRAIWKRFRVTSWSDPWLALLRPTGALRSWVMGHGMRLRMLPTPRPLLMLHRRKHGLCQEGYLLTAKVNEAEDLGQFLKRMSLMSANERNEEFGLVLNQMALLVRDLHRRHLSHRDLKASNWLIVRHPTPALQSSSAEPLDHWGPTGSRVWFIDLVGVRHHGKLSERRKVQNLARLNVSAMQHAFISRSDRLRFLKLYLESWLHKDTNWKGWWKAISAATSSKLKQNQRTGRVLS